MEINIQKFDFKTLAHDWEVVQAEFKAQLEAQTVPTALVDALRLALIQSNLHSIAGKYVPQNVIRAVELGIWTPERALQVAALSLNYKKSSIIYRELLKRPQLLSIPLIEKIETALQAIEPSLSRDAYFTRTKMAKSASFQGRNYFKCSCDTTPSR